MEMRNVVVRMCLAKNGVVLRENGMPPILFAVESMRNKRGPKMRVAGQIVRTIIEGDDDVSAAHRGPLQRERNHIRDVLRRREAMKQSIHDDKIISATCF